MSLENSCFTAIQGLWQSCPLHFADDWWTNFPSVGLIVCTKANGTNKKWKKYPWLKNKGLELSPEKTGFEVEHSSPVSMIGKTWWGSK